MTEARRVPALRIRPINDRPIREEGEFVLYWMIASRRRNFNFALQRATVVARALNKPLVVLEALRTGYPWASDRLHRFLMQGMAENTLRFKDSAVHYHPWVEPARGAGQGLLETLGADSCCVMTDDYPTFFLPRMIEAAGRKLPVRLEAVDSNGLLPMRAAPKTFSRAHDFRRFLHKTLPTHLQPEALPTPDPLENLELPRLRCLSDKVLSRWPATPRDRLASETTLAELPIDHEVRPSPLLGGAKGAETCWSAFADRGLGLYADGRNHPDEEISSGLSPWLHFGHFAVHDIFDRMVSASGWSVDRLGKPSGSREGWWGMPPGHEAFLDELVTWREVGFNMASRETDHADYESLPSWALETLEAHRSDPRSHLYDLEAFERAETHDDLWNAAQRQLIAEGRIHNYLRMLWGKKILHWSKDPRSALRIMEHLNNKYALDGRDPNSYSGIFWVLGRYDRPWGPERDIFGKVRYMTSDSTRKKLKLGRYLSRWT